MNDGARPGWQPKHAWREVERVDPPKRPAANRVFDFREACATYDEATAAEQASRCVQCPNPTCVEACPLEIPIPEVLALTAERRFQEAAELLLATHSLPEVFSNICAGRQLCEAGCVLTAISEAPPINSIWRFVLEYGSRHGIQEPPPAPATGRQVAIIGSGLCGLVAADALSRKGHAVTILDCHAKPGGRVMNGLPGFKIDRQLVQRRISLLEQRGVRFRMNVVCGRDVTLAMLQEEFDAIFFGLGRANAVALDIPGAALRGVGQAYPFVLQNTSDVTLATPAMPVDGRRVVVLGGSHTAVDALRVAIRCHAAEVCGVYRRDRAAMPANPDDIADAIDEGARFEFQAQAVSIIGNQAGEVVAVRCVRTEPGALDASGRPWPKPIAGSEFDLAADIVLVAYGFTPPKLPCSGEFHRLATDARGCLKVDAAQMTNVAGVFAGGSIVRGPAPLALIVRDARKAAAEIDRYLISVGAVAGA